MTFRQPGQVGSSTTAARIYKIDASVLCRGILYSLRPDLPGRGFSQKFCLMGWAAGGPSKSGRREYFI
jgi:hypothetical protein